MDDTRTQVWDFLYRSGPQTVEQIADGTRIDAITISAAIAHEWFEVVDAKVQIAISEPPSSLSGLIG